MACWYRRCPAAGVHRRAFGVDLTRRAPFPPPGVRGPQRTTPMATVQQGLQAQIRNIEATYGKPMSEWVDIISASGLTKHTDVVAMLKKDYGMTHGAAHRVSLVAREQAAAAGPGSDPIGDLYAGKKASLRPLHDALMTT